MSENFNHAQIIKDPEDNYKILGTRPVRHDGVDKVTGRAIYANDVQLQGLVEAAILRSPEAHARILSIDTSEAEAHPGVLAVTTSADFPDLGDKVANLGEGPVNLAHLAANCLAKDKVLYKGHAVAAVAAQNVHIAREALDLIKVEYEPLPIVTDALEAMRDGAPLLHEGLLTNLVPGGEKAETPSNISDHHHFKRGDTEAAFEAAHIVVEREFTTQTVHQGYIEPHAATAHWNQDGQLTVWASTQGSFSAREQTSEVLQVPISKVKVIPCEIGGGFGGKIPVYLEPVAAMLSRKCGRPVKIQMTRDGVFEGTGPTPASFMRIKLGVDETGKMTAGEAWLVYDTGAFPGGVIGPGVMCVFSCYDIEHANIDGYDVCVNKPWTKAYRAPGSTHVAYAIESVVDELAEKLEMDPIDLRLLNAAREGTKRVDGPVYPRIGLIETLEAAKNHDHYKSPLEGPNRGRGVAAGFWFNIGLKSAATAHVNADGTVTLLEGSTDIGGTRTSISMQLAETLGIAAEDINPKVADTDSVGYTDITGGSRVTFATGLAAVEVGKDIISQMKGRAAKLWECEAADVEFSDGVFSQGDNSISFKELCAKLSRTGGLITARASVDPQGYTNGFGVHICDLEVDVETGKVQILRYTALQDAGKAIHPSYVEGQMQGGSVQGIGWALNEEYLFDEKGHMLNPTMLDYRMPTALDVPMIDTVIIEVPNPSHPFGVRGVGETPIVPPPGAIANAVKDATGIRMTDLPMSPPRVHSAITENSNGTS